MPDIAISGGCVWRGLSVTGEGLLGALRTAGYSAQSLARLDGRPRLLLLPQGWALGPRFLEAWGDMPAVTYQEFLDRAHVYAERGRCTVSFLPGIVLPMRPRDGAPDGFLDHWTMRRMVPSAPVPAPVPSGRLRSIEV